MSLPIWLESFADAFYFWPYEASMYWLCCSTKFERNRKGKANFHPGNLASLPSYLLYDLRITFASLDFYHHPFTGEGKIAQRDKATCPSSHSHMAQTQSNLKSPDAYPSFGPNQGR